MSLVHLNGNGGGAMPPSTATAESDHMLSMIERVARDPSVDIARLERLLEVRDRELARVAERAFSEAMAAAQADLEPVRVDSNNPQTRSKYASLAAVDGVLRPVLARHGLSVSFNTEPAAENWVRVVCKIRHAAGHTETAAIDMPADGKGPRGNDVMSKTHSVGSAVSYGRRYLLLMCFSLPVDKDDDGNAASGYRRPDTRQVPAPRPMMRQTEYVDPPHSRDVVDAPHEAPHEHGEVVDHEMVEAYIAQCRDQIRKFTDKEVMRQWWIGEGRVRRDFDLSQEQVDGLKTFAAARAKAIDAGRT